MPIIKPGSTIGILGSGQLGRMLSIAAAEMGYKVQIYSPDRNSPAAAVSFSETSAEYQDLKALETFAESCDVVTIEFENIPADSLKAVTKYTQVHPSPQVLETFQHRLREKTFLKKNSIPCAAFCKVSAASDLAAAVKEIGLPSVLKTAGFGYDGKGQRKLLNEKDVAEALNNFPETQCVLEAFVDFEREFSLLAARSSNGEFAFWEPVENLHTNHILDISSIPARMTNDSKEAAYSIAKLIADNQNIVGVFCVEFFLQANGAVLVNEIAPRVHNSGHLTIESSSTSQFAQHIRAICGLKLGDTRSIQPAAMCNLLGDLWEKAEPNWDAALALPGVSLHLYGKDRAVKGRKMGHLTAIAPTVEEAVRLVNNARNALQKP